MEESLKSFIHLTDSRGNKIYIRPDRVESIEVDDKGNDWETAICMMSGECHQVKEKQDNVMQIIMQKLPFIG